MRAMVVTPLYLRVNRGRVRCARSRAPKPTESDKKGVGEQIACGQNI